MHGGDRIYRFLLVEPSTTAPRATLTAEEVASIARRGRREETIVDQVLYAAGDRDFDFIVVEAGEVDVIRPPLPGEPEELITTWGSKQFLGELNLITGQTAIMTARVRTPGVVYRVGAPQFRELIAADAELSDLLLRAFVARREELRQGAGSHSLEILGSQLSADSHELRTWASRQQLPYRWLDFDDPAGLALANAAGVGAVDLPVAITATAILRNATSAIVSDHLGLTLRAERGREFDLVVVGGGPAGLAAAVYGASEGLSTILLDSVAVGGQAAASSRIENYLGFPSGISGIDLTSRALIQANKFGAQISSPCRVVSLGCAHGHLEVRLSNQELLTARSVIIASGAEYRKLPLDGWSAFEGAGIYYAATDIEARACAAQPVAVVGGANSAGQAAIFLADAGSAVHLIVRGSELDAGMSRYLVDRVLAHPAISVHTNAQVVKLGGTSSLQELWISAGGAEPVRAHCNGLFCFIGAVPATGWLSGVATDDDGFVVTDRDIHDDQLDDAWALLDRRPLPLETSVPGVFAAGDVRSGSMKRVAAAVGEGASAVRSVHLALATAVPLSQGAA
jgi:thioredoxin reductase (NADPH)